MERLERRSKVCVTGATGYIGSYLVKKLLEKGYTVHATLRDINNESKVGILKNIPDSQGKLFLFEADVYNPADFDAAIQGCDFVFHVATPMNHEPGSSQYKDTVEAALAGSRSIFTSCIRSGTVRRLIYTASVVAASPLKEDGTAFKDFMDETCWTPLHDSLSYLYHDDYHKNYAYSKTLTEKELLSYNNNENNGDGLEVVTIPCGLVGGDTIQTYPSGSIAVLLSLITGNSEAYKSLKFLESLLGKIPLVHIEDACEAHIFCMENTSMKGRFLCASSYVSIAEIADYYIQHYPEFNVKKENVEGKKKEDVKWGSTQLCEKGFVYKYDTNMILDDTINCARRIGHL